MLHPDELKTLPTLLSLSQDIDFHKIAKRINSSNDDKTLTGSVIIVIDFPYGESGSAYKAIQEALNSSASQLLKSGVKIKEIHSDKLRDAEMDYEDR